MTYRHRFEYAPVGAGISIGKVLPAIRHRPLIGTEMAGVVAELRNIGGILPLRRLPVPFDFLQW